MNNLPIEHADYCLPGLHRRRRMVFLSQSLNRACGLDVIEALFECDLCGKRHLETITELDHVVGLPKPNPVCNGVKTESGVDL